MTLEEAIKANAVFVNVPHTAIELTFARRGVEMTDDFNVAVNNKELELISADLYLDLATNPEFSEGELSIKFDRDVLMRRARNIYQKYDDLKFSETGFYKIDLNVTRRQ